MSKIFVSGWGRSTWSLTELSTELSRDDVLYIPRGLGRSYGDCASVSGGKTLLVKGHDKIDFLGSDEVIVGSSVSFAELLAVCMDRNLFLPVTPGTRFVTVGGAVASDVHGKNHHSAGSIGNHILALKLQIGDEILRCSPGERPELFWATIGGMGLTGVIIDVHLKLKSVPSPYIHRFDEKLENLERLISRFEDVDKEFEYSVAWIDTLSSGRNFGRGVITYGNHSVKPSSKKLPSENRISLSISRNFPEFLLNRWTMNAFNKTWYSSHSQHSQKDHSNPYRFFYPLDSIAGWNRVYGKRGFVQYQFVVPSAALDSLVKILQGLTENQIPVFLSVLKKLGKGNSGLLSFPIEGYTLAVDIPADFPGLHRILDHFDEIVAMAGGRVYLAKDSRLSKEMMTTMYPNFRRFKELRKEWGMNTRINSDLSLRLDI